ncbi:cyclic nucleotide-binding domain containing [Cordyceps militaris]|uniref:Cyclic nucleotide-binding domain containing n=1 Tax=Cordyceps militaris TaxID=73501 RepID=A0A2H4SJJ8_CORMI|nr:cyclic nucleotide-binding domain containing [Cordyceps militaris]
MLPDADCCCTAAQQGGGQMGRQVYCATRPGTLMQTQRGQGWATLSIGVMTGRNAYRDRPGCPACAAVDGDAPSAVSPSNRECRETRGRLVKLSTAVSLDGSHLRSQPWHLASTGFRTKIAWNEDEQQGMAEAV